MQITLTMSDTVFERDLTTLATRFDRHLEIYAQNGKELAGVKTNVGNLEKKIDTLIGGQIKLVTQDQFWPVRMLVYGTVAVMLLGMLGWIGTGLLAKSQQQLTQEQMNAAAAAAAVAAVQNLIGSVQTQVK